MEAYRQQMPAFAVIHEVKKAVIGKDDCIVKAVAAILAGGHILLNDIPGVGKTTLATALRINFLVLINVTEDVTLGSWKPATCNLF